MSVVFSASTLVAVMAGGWLVMSCDLRLGSDARMQSATPRAPANDPCPPARDHHVGNDLSGTMG